MNSESQKRKPTDKVLFIGNSYTYFHELWDHFAGLARAAGFEVEVDAVTKGGYRLSQMSDVNDEYGAQVAEKLSKPYFDIVFLQEQSHTPITGNEAFEKSVRYLTQKIRAVGARPILYQTWGRKSGSPELETYGWTNESMTKLLANAYGKIGKECNVEVSHVGDAFYDVYCNHPEIELYAPDCSHSSPAGTYLAALCHFATAYGVSPIGNTYYYGVTTPTDAKILQTAAHRAVFG